MPISVFCDESGFTGENLLNEDQKFFAYASVAIEPQEATDLVAEVIRDFRVQGNELKGSRLLKYAKGRKAVDRLLDRIATRTNLVVHHKEYALATKYFEYGFEPLISEVNSLFYAINFHKFIGNILYMNMLVKNPRALDLSQRFEEAVRSDDARLRDLFSVHGANERDPIEQLISFGVYNRNEILRELAQVKGFGGWILELTLTSLWSLLTHWGDRADSLDVYCDKSVPLHDEQDYVNLMVGRTDKVTINFGQRQKSLVFNLASPLKLVDSKTTPGIQLADVLAATAGFAFENSRDSWPREVLKRLFEAGAINDDCVFPEIERADPRTGEAIVNYVTLLELVQRSRDGESLTTGMDVFIRVAYEGLSRFDRDNPQLNLAYDSSTARMVPGLDMHALSLLKVHQKFSKA